MARVPIGASNTDGYTASIIVEVVLTTILPEWLVYGQPRIGHATIPSKFSLRDCFLFRVSCNGPLALDRDQGFMSETGKAALEVTYHSVIQKW